MYKVTRYITSDGKVHETSEKAKKHADERYGNELLNLAHELAKLSLSNNHMSHYKAISKWLDDPASHERIANLKALRDDLLTMEDKQN